eukprot:764058-Hanusia_phi.AAC.7
MPSPYPHQVSIKRHADGSKPRRRYLAIGASFALFALVIITFETHHKEDNSLLLQALLKSSALDFNDAFASSLAENSNLCSKKAEIFEKLDELLKRLQGENSLVNSTVDEAKDSYEETLQDWLSSESMFRMAASKVEVAKEAAKYIMRRVMVDKEVLTKTQQEHAKILEEYPEKIEMTEDVLLFAVS